MDSDKLSRNGEQTPRPQNAGREDRLAAALRANLRKRKEQARARTDGEPVDATAVDLPQPQDIAKKG